MESQQFRIGIFASSERIHQQVQSFTDRANVNIKISTIGLEDAIPLAVEMERDGIEVIIGRRGTAHLLRESLRIPVLSFPHRTLDLLASLKKASEFGRRILITVFRQELSEISIIEELLDIQVVQKIYEDKTSMRQAVLDGSREGCEVAIGGFATQKAASEIGLKFVEIPASDDDIAATIESAKSVALAGRKQKAASRLYRSVIDAASDGIVSVDANGKITTINATAKKKLNVSEKVALGLPIADFFPDNIVKQVLQNKKPIYDHIEKIGDDNFVFNHHPVILEGRAIGAVTTFQHVNQVIRSEHAVRRSLSKGFVSKYDLEKVIHVSPTMKATVAMARQYATTDSTILIMGETGTGKEIFAHGIHRLSGRANKPFVSINCSALPEQLLESELFGHEEGAFTGSKKGGKEGRFELAHRGTIFLDEIDSASLSVQLRLLRVLQEKEVERIGGGRKIPLDVRIIAAASHDLGISVQEEHFRPDLYFRLNVLRIQLPPLRDRREDISLLLDYFIRRFSRIHKLPPVDIPLSHMNQLVNYTWPGNVRQLRNFAERLVLSVSLQGDSDVFDLLYEEITENKELNNKQQVSAERIVPLKNRIKEKAMEDEKRLIQETLERSKFNKTIAAHRLGISRTTLWRKMKEMEL